MQNTNETQSHTDDDELDGCICGLTFMLLYFFIFSNGNHYIRLCIALFTFYLFSASLHRNKLRVFLYSLCTYQLFSYFLQHDSLFDYLLQTWNLNVILCLSSFLHYRHFSWKDTESIDNSTHEKYSLLILVTLAVIAFVYTFAIAIDILDLLPTNPPPVPIHPNPNPDPPTLTSVFISLIILIISILVSLIIMVISFLMVLFLFYLLFVSIVRDQLPVPIFLLATFHLFKYLSQNNSLSEHLFQNWNYSVLFFVLCLMNFWIRKIPLSKP